MRKLQDLPPARRSGFQKWWSHIVGLGKDSRGWWFSPIVSGLYLPLRRRNTDGLQLHATFSIKLKECSELVSCCRNLYPQFLRDFRFRCQGSDAFLPNRDWLASPRPTCRLHLVAKIPLHVQAPMTWGLTWLVVWLQISDCSLYHGQVTGKHDS